MLSELDLDGVVIAVPTDQLVSTTRRCLVRNLGVLVEKPLGVGVSEVLELRSVAAGTRAKVVVGYYRRLARQVVALKGLLASGAIGDVVGVSCKWMIKKQSGYFTGWKASRSRGAGCLMINFIHDLDTMQYLLGPIESVAAMESRRAPECADDLEHSVVLNMRFSGGSLGTAIVCDRSPSPYSYDNTVAAVTKFPRYPADSHHFFGTTGSVAFPSFTMHSRPSAESSWYDQLQVSVASDANECVDDPIAREIDHFGRVLRSKEQPCATVDDAIRNLAVIAAIRLSLESRAEVPVRWA
jgi:predicted dehydrogenase